MSKEKTKSLAGQLRKAFVTVVLIPVLVLGGFIFYSMFDYMEQKRLSESENIVQQSMIDLEQRIAICDNSLRYLIANYNLRDFLLINEQDYLTVSRESKNIGDLFYNVLNTNPYFRSLKLYTDKELYTLTNFLERAADAEQEEWYRRIIQTDNTCWWAEDDKIYIGKKIMASYPPKVIGVIKMEVKYDLFVDSFSAFNQTPVQISILEEENEVYRYCSGGYDGFPGFEQRNLLPMENWSISYCIDKEYYNNYAILNLLPSLVVIILVLVLVCLLIFYFAKKFSRDLSILKQEVQQAQNGNLDVVIQPSELAEIQMLGDGITVLLGRIKQLIREVYGKEIERKNLELNLLQSKIRPHFLYNNLSAIAWLALDSGQDRIYRITTELAAFYRTALNKGQNVDKLEVEMANIRAYINLKQMSREDSFEVEYHVPEEILDTLVPIFILQPLVENSIEHGIDQTREHSGKLSLQAEKQDEWLILRVWDNGSALYRKIGSAEFPAEQFGYGIGNVHKRLQLLCGEESGVKIWTDQNGTTAEIRLQYKQLRRPIK